jgi:hypothetical protein
MLHRMTQMCTNDELLLLPPPKSRHWLYATHAVAQFSEIAWQFSISFFLSALTNHQSLFWLACYGAFAAPLSPSECL